MATFFRWITLKPSTLLFLVIGSALTVWAASVLDDNAGYLLVRFGNKIFESSLSISAFFLLLSIGLIIIVVSNVYRFFEWIFDGKRGQRSASKKTTEGLVALAEGNWSNAEKLLQKSAKKNETPLVNYITAAQAAHEQGEDDRRDDYLRQAHQSIKGVDIAIGLTKARLQFESGQWEQCLATLMMLKDEKRSPSYGYVIKMMAEVYVELNDWEHLVELFPDIKKRKVFTQDEFLAISLQGYQGLLKRAVRGISESAELEQLHLAWDKVTKKMRQTPLLLKEYCTCLIALNADAEAENVILRFLRKDWDDGLVALYGMVNGDDPAQQLLNAETWLQQRPNNAMLLLSLGRISLLNKDWGKARTYFESSLRSRQSAAGFGELGRLLSHLGEHENSNECFQKGLAMISERLPDLPMPETAQDA
ncbi:hypothetical protein A9Q99_14220 [Gammaproteobacteria bacterium 45_16_T64]|nr:hypothetical protein A9Q99_14220 [Gammaproteobacteria bacterium 45_16_T64]